MADGALTSKTPGSLVGRDDDLEHVTAFVDQAAVSGGALLLSGEAGIGKTVLLDAAAAHAEAAGSRVLRAAGAEFEGAVSFAGLNQLLLPLLDQARGLSAGVERGLSQDVGRCAGCA
jgi:predicted ATPase